MSRETGIITVREATRDDNDALIELEWLCAQHFDDETTTLDRRPDFFVKPFLQGDTSIWVAEDEGRLVGIHAGAFQDVMVGGEKVKAVYLYGMRVHPDYHRHGVAMDLMVAAEDASIAKGAKLWFLYVRKGNDPSVGLSNKYGMHRLGETTFLSIETPGLEYLDHPSVRHASPGEAQQLVELINRTHSDFNLYIPHSVDYLNDRLSRVEDYSWDNVYVFEEGGEILACAGVWDKGNSEKTFVHHAVTNQKKTLSPYMVIDWGFAEGQEDAMGSLFQHLLGETARAGRNRAQVWLEPFPLVMRSLESFPVHHVHWFVNWKPIGDWAGSLEPPTYLDLVYV